MSRLSQHSGGVRRSWKQRLGAWLFGQARSTRTPARPPARLGVEALEERALLSTGLGLAAAKAGEVEGGMAAPASAGAGAPWTLGIADSDADTFTATTE